MRWTGWILMAGLLAGGLLAGCAADPPTGPTDLSQRWLFGVESMAGDPALLHPNANRFMGDLAAMPGVRAVHIGEPWNAHLFEVSPDDKIAVTPVLHGGGNCMEITYIVYRDGVQNGRYGLVITPLYAGPEPDGPCVDRAASQLYHALAQQGL